MVRFSPSPTKSDYLAIVGIETFRLKENNGQRQPPAAIMSSELSEMPTAAGRLDAVLDGVALPAPRGFRLHQFSFQATGALPHPAR
jgi:hypothetical protein